MKGARTIPVHLLMTLFLAAPLLAYIYLGTFSRFFADDYCSANITKVYGVIDGAKFWYMNWTGIFTFDLLFALTGAFHATLMPFLGPCAILLWFSALFFAFSQYPFSPNNQSLLITSSLAAALVLFSTLNTTPALAQSLYWQSEVTSVVLPLIVFTVYVGLLLRACRKVSPPKPSLFHILISAATTFIVGGCAETYVALQTTALAVILAFGHLSDMYGFRKKIRGVVIAGLVGSIAALLLIMAAPGNSVRQLNLPPSPHLFALLKISIIGLLRWAKDILLADIHPLTITTLCLVSLLIGMFFTSMQTGDRATNDMKQPIIRWLPVITFVLLLSCFVPSAYGTSHAPPARTQIIPTFVIVCALSLWFITAGRIMKERFLTREVLTLNVRRIGTAVVLGLTAITSVWATQRIFKMIPDARRYALSWDAMDAQIRASRQRGETSVVVPQLHNWAGLWDIGTDTTHWVNQCACNYYGVHLVVAVTDSTDKNH